MRPPPPVHFVRPNGHFQEGSEVSKQKSETLYERLHVKHSKKPPQTCPTCHREHTRNGRYCHACHAAYMREWRKGRVMISRNFFERLVYLASPSEKP